MPLMLDFDPTAALAANYIQNESHVIAGSTTRYWVPSAGCFFTKGLELRRASDNYLLKPGIDYKALHFVSSAAMETGKQVCAIIWVYNTAITGEIKQTYHAVGGQYSATVEALEELLANLAAMNATEVAWGQLVGVPDQFPPTPHGHQLADWYGMGGLITKLEELRQAYLQGDIATVEMIYQYVDNAIANISAGMGGLSETTVTNMINTAMSAHTGAGTSHTKSQVGLPNVPNWSALSDIDANVSGVTGKNTHFMNAAQILSLIQDRVTRAWLGVDNLPNYGAATGAEIDTGTANNRLPTVEGVTRAIVNNSRIGVAAGSAATVLTPFFTANFADANPPTDVASGGEVGSGIQFFRVAKGATISATTPRVQLVLIQGGTNCKGLWTRTHNGTTMGPWTAAGSANSIGMGGLVNENEATEAEAYDGTASNKRITPRRAKQAVFGALRHVGDLTTEDPNATIKPVIMATHANCPSGTLGVAAGHVFMIQTIFVAGSGGDINDATMNRTQYAFGKNIQGVWKRSFAGGVWTLWTDATTNEMERFWANSGVGVFDNKHYDKTSKPCAISMKEGWKFIYTIASNGIGFILSSRYDQFNRISSLASSDGNGEIVKSVGSATLSGHPAQVIKMESIRRNNTQGPGTFFVSRVNDASLAVIGSGGDVAQFGYVDVGGDESKLLTVQAGTNGMCLIDIVKSKSGVIALIGRERITGTIGVIFTRYGENNITNAHQWPIGVPVGDNTDPTFQILLAILGEGQISNRGTWYGTGSGGITAASQANWLKFRESTWGTFIGAHSANDRVYLIFSNTIMALTLTVDAGGELTATAIHTVAHPYPGVHFGPYGSTSPQLNVTSYVRNGAGHLMFVSEDGTGCDIEIGNSAGVIGSNQVLASSRRDFTLRYEEVINVGSANRIHDISYSGGLIWAAIGTVNVGTGLNDVHQMVAVPWDYIKSRNTVLQARTTYSDDVYYSGRSRVLHKSPLTVSDNSGNRIHLLGSSSTDQVLYGHNVYRIGTRNGERFQ